MRKRIVIAVVVLGIVLVFVLRPKGDPIEYHKRALSTAMDEKWIDVARYRIWGGGPRHYARRDKHEKALIKLGYLERREFVVTNIARGDAVSVIGMASMTNISGIARITEDPKTKTVIVIGVREDMPKWEKLIGELQSGSGQ